MVSGTPRVVAASLLLIVTTLAVGVGAAAAPVSGELVTLNYRNESIRKIVGDVARATGESFLFDEGLQGRVTMMVPRPVPPGAALELLDTVLMLRGYAALPSVGGVRKIVKVAEGAAAAAFEQRDLRGEPEGLIATLVQLSTIPAEQLAADLRHMVSASDAVVPYVSTNSLILAGSESRLHRLIDLALALDRAAREDLMIRTLRYRSAQTVAEMLREVFREEPAGSELELWTDARLNAVIVRAPPAKLEELRSFLGEIDRPEESQGLIQILRLRNRDPEPVARILTQLAKAPQQLPPEVLEAGLEGVGQILAGRAFHVAVDASTSSLLIGAEPDTFRIVRQVVEQLDRPRHRISVVLTIYELRTPSSFALGVDAFIPLGDPDKEHGVNPLLALLPSGGLPSDSGRGNAFFARYSRSPLAVPIVDGSGDPVQALPLEDVTVEITAEATEVMSRVLQRPILVVVSGEEHELFVGENVPIPVAGDTATGSQSATQIRQKIERHDTGLTLRLRPTLGERGDVRVELDLERSSVKPTSEAGAVSEVGPTLTSERLRSEMTLRPSEVAVLGVSRDRKEEDIEIGTPWFKDLPALGWLFRSTRKQWVDTRLVIAVEARVLRSPAEDLANSIRQRLGVERQLSRMQGLSAVEGAPYALRVDTREREADGRAIADSLELEGLSTQIGRWKSVGGRELFDVYATGFETIADAGAASLRLLDAGWTPELVVLSVEASADEDVER